MPRPGAAPVSLHPSAHVVFPPLLCQVYQSQLLRKGRLPQEAKKRLAAELTNVLQEHPSRPVQVPRKQPRMSVSLRMCISLPLK